MPSLDTDVLVRWLVDDDAVQAEQSRRSFAASIEQQLRLFVPVTVLLELEWVLRARYRFDKAAIVSVVHALLEAQELDIQFEAAVERALEGFRGGRVDFADCLHVGLCSAAGHAPLFTFDVHASRLTGARLLGD